MKIASYFICLLLIGSCAVSKPDTISAEIQYVSDLSDFNTGTFIVLGYGDKMRSAQIDAEKRLFNKLLFKGIPGLRLGRPFIKNVNQTQEKYSAYFDLFFRDEKYRDFIISTEQIKELSQKEDAYNKQKFASITIKVDLESLRREIENEIPSQKFGL